MSKTADRREAATSEQLHPWIYRTIVGSCSFDPVCVGFVGPGYSGLALRGEHFYLHRSRHPDHPVAIWRNHAADPDEAESFAICRSAISRSAMSPEGRGCRAAGVAAIAAVSIGMAVFALVLYFDVGG